MPENYFEIRYELDPAAVHAAIAERLKQPGADYITVADGVILNTAHRNPEYRRIVNSGMFAICDSSFVPLYIRLIHGRLHRFPQYCGAQIFRDIVGDRQYSMFFIGAQQSLLDSLRHRLLKWNPDVASMTFRELPFMSADSFDYPAIADDINRSGADIIWVSLGAPKQEIFMNRLRPHLHHGVMIAVGAVFKFYAGFNESRAPAWMRRNHLEFIFRISQDPAKQLRRCWHIVTSLPTLLANEYRRKGTGHNTRS